MVSKTEVLQFKLASGEEIVAEVLEFDEEPTSPTEMIIRNAMCLSISILPETNAKYSLKPWFAMLEKDTDLMALNTQHVVAVANPNKHFISEYYDAVGEMQLMSKQRDQYYKKAQEISEKVSEELDNAFKDDSTIVHFPPSDKKH